MQYGIADRAHDIDDGAARKYADWIRASWKRDDLTSLCCCKDDLDDRAGGGQGVVECDAPGTTN